ncbi:MAG: ATP-binding cassette domain-containing protein [Alphaproteobacteria bacterium]
MPENFLSFNDVSYVLPNGETLFSGISFDVSCGEKAALTGRNGAGKTTLFRLAEKVLLPSEGRIVCGETPAFLPQETELNQTVADALGVRPVLEAIEKVNAGICTEDLFDLIRPRWNIRTETERALADFGLSFVDLSDSFGRLSGGEREKILLLNVFLSDAGILMFDEPTNNLDIRSAEILEKALHEYQGSVIIVSHDRIFTQNIGGFHILELS